MAEPTWGMLSKSQEDPETIEEAIERLIAAHNDDETAHIGEGRSLENHKASAVIDHLSGSIIDEAIAKSAVSFFKIAFERYLFMGGFESLDPWFITKTGGRGTVELDGSMLKVTAGTTVDDIASATLTIGNVAISTNRNPFLQVTVLLIDTEDDDTFAWSGDFGPFGNDYGFGFIFRGDDVKLYAAYYRQSDGALIEVDTGITDFDQFLTIRAEHDFNASTTKFYVDGVLVHTATEVLADSGGEAAFSLGTKHRTGTGGVESRFYNPIFSQDFETPIAP